MRLADGVPVDGRCDRRFVAVADAFAGNFRTRGEVGAAVAVTLNGEPVIDLWGGFADSARTRPWAGDTLVCMMSVAKAATALCAAMAVDRGLIAWDEPVARYWPEFAAAGKAGIPVRWLLDHRAGLPAIAQAMPEGAAYDWEAMTGALAAQAPLSPPGEARAYHSVTLGYLVGELIRRTTGKSLGRFLADEVCEPHGIDYWIGLPPELHGRCAEFFGETAGTLFDRSEPDSLKYRAMAQVPPEDFNTERFRAAEIPSINGIGTARGVAKLFDGLAAGGVLDDRRLLSADVLAEATAEQWHGEEDLLGHTRRMASASRSACRGTSPWDPARAPSGIPARAAPSGLRTRMPASASPMRPTSMYSGPGISPRLAALVDALYEVLA